jgi:hypothetical protein
VRIAVETFRLQIDRAAIVVPHFEIIGANGRGEAKNFAPATFASLERAAFGAKVKPFHAMPKTLTPHLKSNELNKHYKDWWFGLSGTDYLSWYRNSAEGKVGFGRLLAAKYEPYPCLLGSKKNSRKGLFKNCTTNEFWEPYLLLRRIELNGEILPRYMEAYVGRFFNKIDFTTLLRAHRYKLFVLWQEFLVHVPHESAPPMQNGNIKKMHQIMGNLHDKVLSKLPLLFDAVKSPKRSEYDDNGWSITCEPEGMAPNQRMVHWLTHGRISEAEFNQSRKDWQERADEYDLNKERQYRQVLVDFHQGKPWLSFNSRLDVQNLDGDQKQQPHSTIQRSQKMKLIKPPAKFTLLSHHPFPQSPAALSTASPPSVVQMNNTHRSVIAAKLAELSKELKLAEDRDVLVETGRKFVKHEVIKTHEGDILASASPWTHMRQLMREHWGIPVDNVDEFEMQVGGGAAGIDAVNDPAPPTTRKPYTTQVLPRLPPSLRLPQDHLVPVQRPPSIPRSPLSLPQPPSVAVTPVPLPSVTDGHLSNTPTAVARLQGQGTLPPLLQVGPGGGDDGDSGPIGVVPVLSRGLTVKTIVGEPVTPPLGVWPFELILAVFVGVVAGRSWPRNRR